MRDKYWKHGEQALVAKAAKVSRPYLNDVLHRRRRCSPDVAIRISTAIERVLRLRIPPAEFVFSGSTKHPAFSEKD